MLIMVISIIVIAQIVMIDSLELDFEIPLNYTPIIFEEEEGVIQTKK